MKKVYLLTILALLSFLPCFLYGQLYLRYTTKPLPIQKELIPAVDSIYPCVKMSYRTTSKSGFVLIDMVYSNDTVRFEDGFKELLLKCKMHNNSSSFSESTSVKVFAYLDFLSSQSMNTRSNFANVISINICSIKRALEYKQESLFQDTSATFNYCVELSVEPCRFRKYRFEHYNTKLKYYINAYKGIVRYFYVEQQTDSGILKSELVKTSAAFDKSPD